MSQAMAAKVVFETAVEQLDVEVSHGSLASIGRPENTAALLRFSAASTALGACATRATVRTHRGAFTFFLRDVRSASPIYIPSLGVAVLGADDRRTYAEVADDVRGRGLQTITQQFEAAPEHTYAAACAITRDQQSPTWLGLGRDIRMFRVSPYTAGHPGVHGYWGLIEPVLHSLPRDLPESKDAVRYAFVLGRGASCSVEITRRLEDGVLPILHSVQRDGDVVYDLTLFASLEFEPLAPGRVRGTHPTAALANTMGVTLTRDELSAWDDHLRQAELRDPALEQVVCFVRAIARNTASVPRYAYLKALVQERIACSFEHGFSTRPDASVIAVHQLNGEAMPQAEMAVLLQPGAALTLDILIPHRPISLDRARALAGASFESHHAAARDYWRAKLDSAAQIHVPEPAIDERIAAGLLHLDLNTLGRQKDGHLLATVGWYSPIGSESSPMIQFYDSIGWHEVAERSIQFFLDRQRDDGFITTFGGYQLETGPTLWTIGEHFRYTRDVPWARRIQPAVARSCDYILAWRQRNLREELRGRGYGLLDGKVADPEDFFHSFMLNALAYVGLKRIAEMYRDIDGAFAARIAAELASYLADIRGAYAENVARSPVIPLDDGTWVPSFAPWAEYPGPVSLFAEGGNWFSHGIFACRDTLIGALYLGIGEVLDPNEPLATWLLAAHQQLMTLHNAGLSQPYYCRHDHLHLARGEVKNFLHTYYNQLAALQDRSTYTFWEHYYGVSQHKTHEEGWFLMQTRWMLWMEERNLLKLLPGVPRAWLAPGKEIRLDNCVSHFGPFSLYVQVTPEHVHIRFTCQRDNPPAVQIRLPLHRTLTQPNQAGLTWDSARELLSIAPGRAALELHLSLLHD